MLFFQHSILHITMSKTFLIMFLVKHLQKLDYTHMHHYGIQQLI